MPWHRRSWHLLGTFRCIDSVYRCSESTRTQSKTRRFGWKMLTVDHKCAVVISSTFTETKMEIKRRGKWRERARQKELVKLLAMLAGKWLNPVSSMRANANGCTSPVIWTTIRWIHAGLLIMRQMMEITVRLLRHAHLYSATHRHQIAIWCRLRRIFIPLVYGSAQIRQCFNKLGETTLSMLRHRSSAVGDTSPRSGEANDAAK